jgi:glycerophosphoryl diester phosphodiesterase
VALAAAIELGCDLIEFDVRATADARLVLMHDERLERTTDGSGRLAEVPLRHLRELDAGAWMGEEHRGRKVPTLNETLASIKGTARFIVDFKETRLELVEELVLSLKADDMLDKAIVASPSALVLQELARTQPAISLAAPLRLVFSGPEPVALARLKPKFLLARAADATPAALGAASGAGVPVLVTLPRDLGASESVALARTLEANGAAGVVTCRARAFLQTGLRML